jgi:hypothetical protein
MASKLKTEVRIDEPAWESDLTFLLSPVDALAVVKAMVRGDLKVSLLTDGIDDKQRDAPELYRAS